MGSGTRSVGTGSYFFWGKLSISDAGEHGDAGARAWLCMTDADSGFSYFEIPLAFLLFPYALYKEIWTQYQLLNHQNLAYDLASISPIYVNI